MTLSKKQLQLLESSLLERIDKMDDRLKRVEWKYNTILNTVTRLNILIKDKQVKLNGD